ncbi:MAG: polyphosphate kinase 2 family protein [Acidimicrobiales bacterium]|nr:polyphosphate kinase 2 family protein [Acidimicrobiales bacterium]
MRLPRKVIEELVVAPGSPAGLSERSTSATTVHWFRDLGRRGAKDVLARDLEAYTAELAEAQNVLYASDRWAVLVILQGLDAAGKDGTIKHVLSGVNPQGCDVVSFKEPSEVELRHDFLWRAAAAVPARGMIGVFNRSHYEEVLVVRVHPELLAAQRLPPGSPTGADLWRQRYEDINAFEHHLARNGTRIVKFFLHLSKEEQRRRFLARIDRPSKRWKLTRADLHERDVFDAYRQAYEEALTATSTPWAPWHVVPADHKPAMRALVAGVIVDTLDGLDLAYPSVDPAQMAFLDEARRKLEAEEG